MLVTINKLSLKKIAIFGILITAVAVFLLPGFVSPVLAQGADELVFGSLENEIGNEIGLGSDDPRLVIARIIRIFIGFLGIIAVILIMYAGFLWMTSEGNPEQIERAKNTLKNATIGLIIIFSSFGLVSFFINQLMQSTGIGGPGTGTGPGAGIGYGAIGSCTVESTYPQPNQNEVPRNTTLMITFKEEVKQGTVCLDAIVDGGNGNGICDAGEYIDPAHIRISKASDNCAAPPAACPNAVTDVTAITNDNKTFVLIFDTWLGSPSEYIWYEAHFTNDIEKIFPNNPAFPGIFQTCNPDWFNWQFEVSNKIDLVPPQVKNVGVFPAPDDVRDSISTTMLATQATGDITVDSQPSAYSSALAGIVTAVGISPPGTAVADANSTVSGTFTVSVLADGVTAELSDGVILLGTDIFSGGQFTFNNYFTLSVSGAIMAGYSWEVPMTAEVISGTLTVGSIPYTFVSGVPGPNEIQVGASTNITADNIASTLNARPDLSATSLINVVNLTASTAGVAGNDITLASSTAGFTFTQMNGGLDLVYSTTVNDEPDQPRNSTIQINFNEAINPITVSGVASTSSAVSVSAIVVKCINIDGGPSPCSLLTTPNTFACGPLLAETCLTGRFEVSNQYRTVEFISDNVCGANACGDNIYCLPQNSMLQVELMAANLETCVVNTDCASKDPYTTCNASNVCENATSENYPLAGAFDGIIDAAKNSFDGDRSGEAEGPGAFYNENTMLGNGDDYNWSFFISEELNLTPPIIDDITTAGPDGIVPASGDTSVSLVDPVQVTFNKVMRSGSLRTGGKTTTVGNVATDHRLLNIWSFSGSGIGYWIESENIDTSTPPDGSPEYTKVYIQHSMFSDATSYQSQAGSGLTDIYQNCFNPSTGPGCVGVPYCCLGVPSAVPCP